jgi:hypothetical protein
MIQPRFVRIPDSTAYAFVHECCICGNPMAPYGEAYSARNGKPGRWYCRPHWIAHNRPSEEKQ